MNQKKLFDNSNPSLPSFPKRKPYFLVFGFLLLKLVEIGRAAPTFQRRQYRDYRLRSYPYGSQGGGNGR